MSSGVIYVMDEYQKEKLVRLIREAKTLDQIKEALLTLLDELPVEYVGG